MIRLAPLLFATLYLTACRPLDVIEENMTGRNAAQAAHLVASAPPDVDVATELDVAAPEAPSASLLAPEPTVPAELVCRRDEDGVLTCN